MPHEILDWGIAVVLALQGLGDWLIGPMNLLTFSGNIEFYLLVLPALYWCYNTRLGIRLAIVLMLSVTLNSILKVTIHDPRPYWYASQVRLLTGPETTFGIPSGHSQNAVIIWGILGNHIKKGWAWIVFIALIFLIGFSRIYLGVHFPTDVIAGWALGILLLLIFIRFESTVIRWMTDQKTVTQIAIVFVTSLVMIAMGVLVTGLVSARWAMPVVWIENVMVIIPTEPIAPFSLDDLITSGAALFGLATGFIWLETRGGVEAAGPWQKRLGRYLVGLVGVLILWRGLGEFFSLLAVDESGVGYVLRYIRYGLIGAWVAAGAPVIFIRLGLAEPALAGSASA